MTATRNWLVPDTTARAVMLALAECDSIGVAILAPPLWHHVLASVAYERVLGVEGTLGRSIAEVAPACSTLSSILDDVQRSGTGTFLASITLGLAHGGARHASLALLPLENVGTRRILVVAQDVTERFKDWRALNLSVGLAADLTAGHDLPVTIRAATARAAEALDASGVSIFLASRHGTALEGAFREPCTARSCARIELDAWPNVKTAIERAAAVYLAKDDALGAEKRWFDDEGIGCTLCVPLICAHDVLGVMFFDFETPVPAALVNVAVAQGIADQCASALAAAKASVSASALRVLWSLAPAGNG